MGTSITSGKTFGLVKAENYSAILRSPFSGEIKGVSEVVNNPNLINKSPYDEGWLLLISLDPSLKEQASNNWVNPSENLKDLKKFIEVEIKNNSLLPDDCCPDLLGGSGVVRRKKK